MVEDVRNRRVGLLLAWRTSALADGHPVPAERDLIVIGQAGGLGPPPVAAAHVEPWRDTIEYLLKMDRMQPGYPVSRLPDDLREPAPTEPAPPVPAPPVPVEPVPAPPVPVEPVVDPVLAALYAWREAALPRNPDVAGIKDGDLQRIVSSGSRSADDIRQHLGGRRAVFAEQIAGVIAAHGPGPAAQPEPEPVADPDPGPPDLGSLDLADYRYGTDGRPRGMAALVVDERTVDLSWDKAPATPDAPVVVYRVVASGDGAAAPDSPQEAVPVARTTDVHWRDQRLFTGVVRHYRVWYHAGRTLADAAAAEPVLLAGTAAIVPLRHAAVELDPGGREVWGRWKLPAGVRAAVTRRDERDGPVPIGADGNAGGFRDGSVRPGRTYHYDVVVEAEVGGVRQAGRTRTFIVTVPSELAAITDLVVTPRPDREQMDMTWTRPEAYENPDGDVWIYVAGSPLGEGIPAGAVSLSELQALGLGDRQNAPIPPGPGPRDRMEGVPWAPGTTRAFVTPVTVLAGEAKIGKTFAALKPLPPLADVRLVERNYMQMLTFAWPEGADKVEVYVATGDDGAEVALRGKAQDFIKDHYDRYGGMQLAAPLPVGGCTVYVVPVAVLEGRQHLGEPKEIRYLGLIDLDYWVFHKDGEVIVDVWSWTGEVTGLRFTLLTSTNRFPLHEDDKYCTALDMECYGGVGGIPGKSFSPDHVPLRPIEHAGAPEPAERSLWRGTLPPGTRYLRLFAGGANTGGRPIALTDPPMHCLRLREPPGEAR